jgi:hypothetical protein
MSHRLKRVAPPPRWPTFKGTAQYVGTSSVALVSVYVDPTLGASGAQNATDLLADADRVVKSNNAIFGTPSQPVNVIVFALDGRTDGTGGADHNSCDFITGGDIEVCASFGSSARVSALFEAELSECAMGGNLCGVSTGEALSRWCAALVGSNALADFASAPAWAKQGMPDFVTRTDNTDQNEISTGCAMAFLSWLQRLGYPLQEIAQAMVALGTGGVLAQLYGKLTGDGSANAWPKFLAAAKALPAIASDDPFGTAPRKTRSATSAGPPAASARKRNVVRTLLKRKSPTGRRK